MSQLQQRPIAHRHLINLTRPLTGTAAPLRAEHFGLVPLLHPPAPFTMRLLAATQHPQGAPARQQRQSPAAPKAVPQSTGRRRLLSAAVPLMFLPWRGCDQGGNYSTGVAGTHGNNCQQIYQPAAAAEKRFAAAQQAAAAQKQQEAAAAAVAAAEAPASPPEPAPVTAGSGREELRTLLKEQQAYEREAMRAENERRTQDFVESMWQSLD